MDQFYFFLIKMGCGGSKGVKTEDNKPEEQQQPPQGEQPAEQQQ